LVVSQNRDKNIIIGNYYHEKYTTFEKFPPNNYDNNTYENIIDLTTYARTDSSENEKNIIELIEKKHANNCDKYTHVTFRKLLFLADNIFFKKFFQNSRNNLMKKNYQLNLY